MSDKIAKLLAKLPRKQLELFLEILTKINHGDLTGLDVKRLKGHKNLYRVRVGDYRIIFTLSEQGKRIILLIAKRDENTYKGL